MDLARIAKYFLISIIAASCANGGKQASNPPNLPGSDPLNTTYTIEDQAVTLINGSSEIKVAPGSAARIRATVFGLPLYGDLDRDGDEDAVVVILYDPGGSGTFYYIAVPSIKMAATKGRPAICWAIVSSPSLSSLTTALCRPTILTAGPPSP